MKGAPLSSSNRFPVAVLPLRDAVLFPGVTLSLHLIQSQYQELIRNIEEQGWPVAVSLVVSESHEEFMLNPICGAGQIQVCERYPQDSEKLSQGLAVISDEPSDSTTADVLVHGELRVRLCSVLEREPVFLMEAESLEGEVIMATTPSRSFTELLTLVKTWAFIHPELPEPVALVFDAFEDYGELADFFVFHFMKDVHEKQRFLNCTDPVARGEMLAKHLEQDLLKFSKKLRKQVKFSLLH